MIKKISILCILDLIFIVFIVYFYSVCFIVWMYYVKKKNMNIYR